MKLWNKGYTTDQIIEKFTVGNDRITDLRLAKYDILGNMAHAKMLHKIGILTEVELTQMLDTLQYLLKQVENGNFKIEDKFEDIHSKIEYELTQKIGDIGKKIHTARSRNDQVLVDLHLYIKDEIENIKNLVMELFFTLTDLSEKHKNVLIPGYTHTQVAMPSSFGLWFGAYAESLIDDIILLNAAFKIANQNPLGSAAGYGSSFPIDRDFTTRELGFDSLKINVIAAQMSRGKLEKTMSFALSSLANTMSKFSSDAILYMSQNFGFLKLPKELTTGSSIMPHKQNPDVFELIRANCNKIQNLPAEIILITNNLTSGYHRDYQILKELTFNAIDSIKDNLSILTYMVENLQVQTDVLHNKLYENIYSVENVNELVMNGMTFRDAYQKVGKEILEHHYKPEKKINHTHKGSIGNLCINEIIAKFEKNF